MKFVYVSLLLFLIFSCSNGSKSIVINNKSTCENQEQYCSKAIKASCDSIRSRLNKASWRKHPLDNCYVIDSVYITSILRIYENNNCGKHLTSLKLIELFGQPIDIITSRYGVSFYRYPFVLDSSIIANKQNVWNYSVSKQKDYFVFPNTIILDNHLPSIIE